MPRRSHSWGRLVVLILWGGALVVSAGAGPRLMEGYSALLWTRFHAARVSGPHPGEHARKAGHAAARTIELTSPMPWAREAARLAMDAAVSLESQNRPSAIAAYEEVGAALDRVMGEPFRGLGLSSIAAEVRARTDEAKALPGGSRP